MSRSAHSRSGASSVTLSERYNGVPILGYFRVCSDFSERIISGIIPFVVTEPRSSFHMSHRRYYRAPQGRRVRCYGDGVSARRKGASREARESS
jgi:hypothetical protein